MNEPLNRRSFLQAAATTASLLSTMHPVDAASTRRSGPGSHPGLVAFRISNEQWQTDERFEALIRFFRQCPGVADEIAFFTSSTHPPLPLSEIQQRAEILAKRMPRIRAEGMSAGINLLATMGHHEENLDGSLAENWARVTDPQGRSSRGSFCPASDELRAYVAQVYTALAEADPDFIWIDDDVRLAGHMPVGMTCFCEGCVARYSKESGRPFTRGTLLASFQSGSLEERLAARVRWLDHNRAMLDSLFALIEQTVHRVRPGLALGFMTGDRFYEGYGFSRWAGTLAGADRGPVRWRPGGGFYSDESLTGLAGKAHDIGRQVSQLPRQVEVIQSEIENFPYDLLRKAAETTVVEAAAHMAAGCTGTAFNVLSQRPDPLAEYDRLLHRIHRARPFYRALREEFGRSPVVGVWPAWTPDIFSANSVDGAWPEGGSDAVGGLSRGYVLSEIGIPIAYGPEGSRVAVFSGPGLLAFSKDDLRRHFSGGVLMDAAAWQSLNRLGLASWTGVSLGEVRARDAIEVLSEHALNGSYHGYSRDCRQSFWHETAQELRPNSASTDVLARMIDYSGRDLGASMTLFKNELGGRVVVMGYFPWMQLHHLAKSTQMKSVCAWLADGRLPVVVDSFARVHLWVREQGPDRVACLLLNGSLDPAEELAVRVPARMQQLRWTDFDGKTTRLAPGPRVAGVTSEAQRRLKVPGLGAWSVGLLTLSASTT